MLANMRNPFLLEQSPLSGCSPFPVVEGAEERVGVFVAQEIGGFIKLPRRVQEVVTGPVHDAPRPIDAER